LGDSPVEEIRARAGADVAAGDGAEFCGGDPNKLVKMLDACAAELAAEY